jgi:hypothetical protein
MHRFPILILGYQALESLPGSIEDLVLLIPLFAVRSRREETGDVVLLSKDEKTCANKGPPMGFAVSPVLVEGGRVFFPKGERNSSAPRTLGVASVYQDGMYRCSKESKYWCTHGEPLQMVSHYRWRVTICRKATSHVPV